jgi:hypothetical protein
MTASSAVFSGTNIFKAGEFLSSTVRSLSAFWDGGGSAVSVAKKIYVFVPVALKIEGWAVFCDVSATLTIDIWSVLLANAPPTVTNTICNSNYPAITAGTQNSLYIPNSALGFTTGSSNLALVSGAAIIPAGSALIFNVASNNNATVIKCDLLCRSGS